jgi:imidazolonepropionase
MWDVLLLDCRAATMDSQDTIDDAAIGITGGRLAYVGPRKDLPPDGFAATVRPLGGAWVLPGFIDCHTHLVYAGDRSREHEMRSKGASYEEIARAGGGIMSTVRATREASEEFLLQSASQRANRMAREGVTTIEIKSGYGLDLENELKMLRVAARVGEKSHVRILRTFLGAHAVPPEYADNRAAYVDLVCEEMIPAVARGKLADAVDAFCETIAFTPAETDRIFATARAHGLRVKLHADQRSDLGGGALAARHKALSADHLEYLNQEGVAAMARAGTVAVLLPCAFRHLRETHKPPIEALRRAGVPIAISTDCNPGTSPVTSPLILKDVACEVFGLTPEEALLGMTRNAALALGLEAETGTLTVGKSADLAVWDVSDPLELHRPPHGGSLVDRYFRGRSDKHMEAP